MERIFRDELMQELLRLKFEENLSLRAEGFSLI